MVMRPVAVIAIVGYILVGCASKPWSRYYEPLTTNKYPPTHGGTVSYEEADFSALAAHRELSGYELLGVTTFRGDLEMQPPGARGSALRTQAERIGAQRVLWASRSLGEQPRTIVTRRYSPSAPMVYSAPPPVAYDVNSTVYGPRGTYQVQSHVQPSGLNSGQSSAAQSFQEGVAIGAAGARNYETDAETIKVPVYEYLAYYYRRIGG